jgi:putative ABC transport system permease protein
MADAFSQSLECTGSVTPPDRTTGIARWIMTWLHDVRYSIRVLARERIWSLTAMITLSLGLAGTVATFTFVNAFLFRPLPFRDPERLVHVWGTTTKAPGARGRISIPDFLDLQKEATLFEDLAAFNYAEEDLVGGSEPERVFVGRVTTNAFDVLGVGAVIGRGFKPGADASGAQREVVLAHAFWTTRFAADPLVVGTSLQLNGEPHTIVGVMPRQFVFPLPVTQIWAPRAVDVPAADRSRRSLQVFGRLKPPASSAAAASELAAIAGRLSQRYPAENTGVSVRLVPLRDALNFASDVLAPLIGIVAASVGFVFLIVCANVASLLLSRGVTRGREMAVRAALGAGRLRLVRQVLTESLVLAVGGGAGGVLLASWSLARMNAAVPPDLYRVGELALDGEALAFALLISTGSVLLFGVVPALRTTSVDLNVSLKGGTPGTAGAPARRGGQRMLVAGQVAASTVLLVAAVLMLDSLRELRRVAPGFEPDQVLTLKLILPDRQYPDAARLAEFHRVAAERAARLTGVQAAGTVDYLPLNHETASVEAFRPGDDMAAAEGLPANLLTIGGDYFAAMDIPMLRGSMFDAAGRTGETPSAIVSLAFAQRLYGENDVVGRRFVTRTRAQMSRTYLITGVANDSHHRSLREGREPNMYVSQLATPTRYMRLLVRSAPGVAAAQQAGPLRDEIRRLNPALPITEVRTMRAVLDEYLLPESNISGALVEHSVTALVLALVGIYGVVAFSVAARTREIGVRMALGASRGQVLWLFLHEAARLSAAGLAIGLAVAYLLTRFLSAFLFGVSANDVPPFIAVGLILFACSMLASCIPAYRATRVDPVTMLRTE